MDNHQRTPSGISHYTFKEFDEVSMIMHEPDQFGPPDQPRPVRFDIEKDSSQATKKTSKSNGGGGGFWEFLCLEKSDTSK